MIRDCLTKAETNRYIIFFQPRTAVDCDQKNRNPIELQSAPKQMLDHDLTQSQRRIGFKILQQMAAPPPKSPEPSSTAKPRIKQKT